MQVEHLYITMKFLLVLDRPVVIMVVREVLIIMDQIKAIVQGVQELQLYLGMEK
jgi:hypothetical protein